MNSKNNFGVLALLSLLMIGCGEQKKTPTTYLIPENIRGQVIIIYNYPEGAEEIVTNNKRVLEIPETKILYTQAIDSYGVADDDYFLVSKNGKRKRISIEVNAKNKNDLCIYNIVTGKIKIDQISYPYEGFMVCCKDSIASYNDYDLSSIP